MSNKIYESVTQSIIEQLENGAAYLCQDYRIAGELRHAGYIGHWLKAMRADSKAIFKAAALAQKAADYLNQLDATTSIELVA